MTQTSPNHDAAPAGAPPVWSPWRTIVAFGFVSLAADMVYEGMRAMAGPFLGLLGASALTVGVVTGAGEAVALVLRLATGVWADRSQHYWRLTVVGYAMTAVTGPLLAVTPFIGGAGLAVAASLILLERTGKAIRSPARSALVARMSASTGRGKGFGVQKALDQVGAFSGPLLLAGVAALTGLLWPGFALLAIPGALSLLLLAQMRRHAPMVVAQEHHPSVPSARPAPAAFGRAAIGADLPRTFHLFAVAVALMTAGLMTFGVLSFRFVHDGVVALAAVPLVYALAMAAGALAALATGQAFDRFGGRVLLLGPGLVAIAPLGLLATPLWLVLLGVVVWGIATGIQDSTVKAYVADLVPPARRASAYGVFAAVQGVGALLGGAVAGAVIESHKVALAMGIAVLQTLSLLLLWGATRPAASEAASPVARGG